MAVLSIHETECRASEVDSATGVASTYGVKVLCSTSNESALWTKWGLASADTLTD